jgi:uncharacterized protein
MLCDASILVPLFIAESSSDKVTKMLANKETPLVSDFAIGEVCSAISIRLRRGEIDELEANEALSDLDLWCKQRARRITIESHDVNHAIRLVRRFDLALRMPDALILAVAHRHAIPVATLDRRQAIAANAIGLQVFTTNEI